MESSSQYRVSDRDLMMFIIGVLVDVETVPLIVELLNDTSGTIGWRDRWPHPFTDDEVIAVIEHMLEDGILQSYDVQRVEGHRKLIPVASNEIADIRSSSDLPWDTIGSLWFGRTERGLDAYKKWISSEGN